MATVQKRNKGFTLVEVMVAIAILMISMLAVLHALGLSVEHNMKNLLMDEAVRISEQTMNELRNQSVLALVNGNTSTSRRFRNITVTFNTNWIIQNLSANSRAIQVVVRWTFRGIPHIHSATSIVSVGP